MLPFTAPSSAPSSAFTLAAPASRTVAHSGLCRAPLALLCTLLPQLLAAAQVAQAAEPESDPQGRFDLGVVEVVGAPRVEGQVDAATLQRADAQNAGAALAQLPGVSLSRVGARNELMVQVRGFDLRQVPVFVDGVPVYVPYDGYVDLGRFTTFDLAAVQLDKGFSSMLYGANTLGGAINLVGRRPSKPLEVDAAAGLATDRDGTQNARWASAQLGTRREGWYAQAGASVISQDSVPVGDGFAPVAAEDGGARNNSDALDRKLSLKLGWLPGGRDEYTISFIDQHGSKGTPPYAGSLSSPRYWRWPYWDKQSLYAVSRTALGEHTLKLRLFHDTFRNSLFAYDDATYTTQAKKSSFQSWYDDFSNGASAQLDLHLGSADSLGLAAHWKEDVHREHNAGEPVRHFKDQTTSLAAEHTHDFSGGLTLIAGLGHDTRDTQQAQDYNAGTKTVSEFPHADGSASNAQVALRQDLGALWQIQGSLARKSRFPTLKDRYSYRMGTALPNADLAPERATHAELRLSGRPSAASQMELAVFRSRIDDAIQSVTIDTMCGANACTQMRNVGRARVQGGELGAALRWGAWQLDGHYQYLDKDILGQSAVLPTDAPLHSARVHAGWQFAPTWTLHAQAQGGASRYTNSTGTQVSAGYGTLDLKLSWQLRPQVVVEASVNNVADRLYTLSEGFPEPGRQILLQARLQLR